MATIHLYLRACITGSNAQVDAIAAAMDSVRQTVGEAWTGSVRVDRDPDVPVAVPLSLVPEPMEGVEEVALDVAAERPEPMRTRKRN